MLTAVELLVVRRLFGQQNVPAWRIIWIKSENISYFTAGPAFEGGNISCGMGSVAGAVCHVSLDENNRPSIETIGWGLVLSPDAAPGLRETGARFTVPAHGSGRGISKAERREMKGTENIQRRISEEIFDSGSLNR